MNAQWQKIGGHSSCNGNCDCCWQYGSGICPGTYDKQAARIFAERSPVEWHAQPKWQKTPTTRDDTKKIEQTAAQCAKNTAHLDALEGQQEALSSQMQSALSSLQSDIQGMAAGIQAQTQQLRSEIQQLRSEALLRQAQAGLSNELFNARLQVVETMLPKIWNETLSVDVCNKILSVDVCNIYHGLGIV